MADTFEPCGCTTVQSLVTRASRILADSERDGVAVLWPNDALVDYLNEGLALLQSLRPDSFVATVTLQLKEGGYQCVPDTIDSLVELLDNTNGTGTISTGSISEADNKARNAIQGYDCSTSSDCTSGGDVSDYRVQSFTRSGTDPSSFYVQPPVPAGATPSVTARVVLNPPCHDAGNMTKCVGIPRKHEAALVDWMLHRAWLTDIESEFAFRSAAAAHDRFYLIVNAARLNEARFGSKYWLGREGDGDENVNARNVP